MEWEERFIELYTSVDLDDVKDGFKLKRVHIPPKLYRYRAIDDNNLVYRKCEIANGELFLSHPKKLNDPFECWSFLHSTVPTNYVDKFTYLDYYWKNGQEQEVQAILQNDAWFEALIALQTSGSKTPEEGLALRQAIEESIMLKMEEFNQEIRKRIIDMVRIACFSTTATNLPMWYYYANKRKGICIEYSTDRIKDPYQLDSLFPVQYVKELPDMTYMLAHRNTKSLSMPTYLSFHKLKDWSYENEWRMIYDSGYWIRKGKCLPEGFISEGVTIDFIKPTKVILGVDIEPFFEEEISNCALENGVSVVKSQLTEYGLDVDCGVKEK